LKAAIGLFVVEILLIIASEVLSVGVEELQILEEDGMRSRAACEDLVDGLSEIEVELVVVE
jgi:hypothetical protein